VCSFFLVVIDADAVHLVLVVVSLHFWCHNDRRR
jgi:hypothetical protein